MTEKEKSHFALILPGAVAKGAYEAGVIDVLTEKNIKVDRIVATSSGSLNGIAYAAGIRAGREREMTQLLTQSWIENGDWFSSLSFNPLNWFAGRGLSGRDGLLKMMRDLVKPCHSVEKNDVQLRIIVSPLSGVMGHIGKRPATTYEKMLKFGGEDFDSEEGLNRMFDAVTAACAFPGLFAPVDVEGLGLCVDGGCVNNAPIKYALDESDVNRIIMPIPFPAIMEEAKSLSGVGLLNHLVEILINERLYRDLNEAHIVNRETEGLRKLVESGVISATQLSEIQKVLNIRTVEINEIRPVNAPKQNPFSGFFKKADRESLVEQGRAAARASLT